MGVEIELITPESVNDAVEDIRSELGDAYCICKTDGSLPTGGLEIVSAPRGLAEHIEKFKGWNIASYYYAWNGGRCGMHVHMDSKAFTKLTLGKFIMFINSEHNTDFIRKLAGRHAHRDEQARSYCAVEGQEAMANASKALKGKSTSRYYMVNTTCLRRMEADRLGVQFVGERDFNTIELRIFRATLKKERLLAQIEFTHAAVMFCRVASWRDLNGASFIKWLRTVVGQYPALTKWYGVRQIHTSTPTVIAPASETCADAVPPAPWQPQYTEHRHNHEYPVHIPYDSEAETIRTWVERNNLYFRFATYSGSEYAFFPYGDMDTIAAGDVVYMRSNDLWVLMNESFASTLSQCEYEVSLVQPV